MLLALGVLLTDVVLAAAGAAIGAVGVVVMIGFSSLVVKAIKSLIQHRPAAGGPRGATVGTGSWERAAD